MGHGYPMRRSIKRLVLLLLLSASGGCGGRIVDTAASDASVDTIAPAPTGTTTGTSPVPTSTSVPPSPGPDAGTKPPPGDPCTEPGDIEKRVCGKCGRQIRTCAVSRVWNPWKPCEDEIPDAECAIGEVRVEECGNCGKEKDTCDPVECTWVVGTCTGEGPCGPGDIDRTPASCPPGEYRERICDTKCSWPPFGPCTK